jgi:outer membrane lipoprotein-sorting protein
MKHIRSLLTLALTGIAIAGCTSDPANRHTSAPVTASTGADLAAVQSNLSDIDGKAVSIQKLLKP